MNSFCFLQLRTSSKLRHQLHNMFRSRAAFILLTIFVCTTGTQGIHWDDDDGASTSASRSELFRSPSAGTTNENSVPDTSPTSVTSEASLDMTIMADKMATPATAMSTVTSTHRNWVGHWSLSPDAACYREAHFADKCPSNFDRNELTNTCWTECPLGYPVECGMECIQQNNDCKREVLAKTSAVAMSSLSMATFGVFGELAKLGKTVTRAVKCTNSLLSVLRGILLFTRIQMTEDPQTPRDKLLTMLYQTNNVVTDLPIAIYACLGKDVPPNLRLTQSVLSTAQWILLQVLGHGDDIISSWKKFKAFLKGANFTEAAEEITEGEISNLETAMQKNSTCGSDMKSLLDRTWQVINEFRAETPGISDGDLRLKLSESDFVRYDIATVTNNCMNEMTAESSETTAYATRETLRKTFGVIINDLIKSGTSGNGTSLEEKHTAYKWIDNGLITIAVTGLDPTDLSTLFAEYLMTICGPTQFMGEIDDGTEDATLGLNALKGAFKGSTSSWTKEGDGKVIINFTSKDTKNVTVNIMSGGDKIDKVKVSAGGTASWTSSITTLGGKTLYLDRWRPGFLGLPGTGGGSLVLWVPIARQGGHLEVEAHLNVS